MPLPPSRMNREEGEAGEIYDEPPPPRREPVAQRYPSAAGSYASLALDPPSHLQQQRLSSSSNSSNVADDSHRRGGGRTFVPRGGRGREGGPPGRFSGRYGTNEESLQQHRPPFHSRPEHQGISGEFSTGLPPQRGAPVLANNRGRGFPPGGRFPARGQPPGRWIAGRERAPEQDAVHEPASTFSSGFPVQRGGRGPFPPRGGPMDGRGRGFHPRGGGVFEGRGRLIPSRGRVMDGRGFPSTARGGAEGRGPPPPMSHRPPPDFETKRTYSDLVNEPPQSANFPDPKRVRGNPSFGSEGELVPQKQEVPRHPSAYHTPSHSMPPGAPAANSESLSTRGPPLQEGGPPRPRPNFPPGPPLMHPSSQSTFRQQQSDWGGSLLPPDRNHNNMDDRHSMDRPMRGPANGNRPGYNGGSQINAEAWPENRALSNSYNRPNHLNSANMSRGDGPPPPPLEAELDHPGPPRSSTSWGSLNNQNNNNGGPPSGIGQGGMGGPPQEAQRQFPPPHHSSSFGHRPLPEAAERGGFMRGGPGRGFFPGRGDGRGGRAIRAREIIAGRGGDILGGRGPPAPPPLLSTYEDYGHRPPPMEYGGGRGRGRGGGRMAHSNMQSPQPSLGWSNRVVSSVQTEASSNDVKTISPTLPTPILTPPPPPEPSQPEAPEPAEPSGYVTALIRLADLEAQMEYEFAKHMQLLTTHQELKAQYQVLENLPVGLDAIKEDLARLENKASA